jgi:hypothetical protein
MMFPISTHRGIADSAAADRRGFGLALLIASGLAILCGAVAVAFPLASSVGILSN